MTTISTTSFSFKETATRQWTIVNICPHALLFSFVGYSSGAVKSCRIKPSTGSIPVGGKISGTMTATEKVDEPQEWHMELVMTQSNSTIEIIDVVINRSKQDKLKEKSMKITNK